MARTDRLMRLMDALRRLPQPVTAARLAAETGVSPRQLYRDIATLRAGGALIDGAAGLGYTLTEDTALPPQSFSRLEIEALVLALGGLAQLGDPALAEAGRSAVARIVATLPDRQARQAMHPVLHAWHAPGQRPPVTVDLGLLRQACWDETSLHLRYRDTAGQLTEREVWPLSLSYSDQTLTLLAFCRLRQDFRVFHVSRMDAVAPGGESFRPRRVGLLRDYVAQYRLTRRSAPAP